MYLELRLTFNVVLLRRRFVGPHNFFVVLLLSAYGAYSMSTRPVLFSAMSGVVNFNGDPSPNVELFRKIDGKNVDQTVTDSKGEFSFPVVYQKKSLLNFLPTEFAVQQVITAVREGKEYSMWVGVKREPQDLAESKGKALVVNCELNLEKANRLRVNNGVFYTFCEWDVAPDEEVIIDNIWDS